MCCRKLLGSVKKVKSSRVEEHAKGSFRTHRSILVKKLKKVSSPGFYSSKKSLTLQVSTPPLSRNLPALLFLRAMKKRDINWQFKELRGGVKRDAVLCFSSTLWFRMKFTSAPSLLVRLFGIRKRVQIIRETDAPKFKFLLTFYAQTRRSECPEF